MTAAMLAAVSEATWGFLTAIVVNVAGLIVILRRQSTTKSSLETANTALEQINIAVNHRQPGEPTLVERVVTVERRTEEIANETTKRWQWEHRVLTAIANHVGLVLPHHDHPHAHDHEYDVVHD